MHVKVASGIYFSYSCVFFIQGHSTTLTSSALIGGATGGGVFVVLIIIIVLTVTVILIAVSITRGWYIYHIRKPKN